MTYSGELSGNAPRKVSVVVPTCNRAHLLRGALASIRALEGPDLVFEILVADNGEPHESSVIAEEFGAIYVRVAAKGAAAARTEALSRATGEFIAFLDDDDEWLPSNVRAQLAMLDENPELDGVIAQVITTDPTLQKHGEPWPAQHPGTGDQLVRAMLSGFFPQIGSVVVRKRVRDLIGFFDETLIGGQDLDWQLRIARRHTLGHVRTPVVLFRGREPGTYESLQLRRVGFDRLIFLRHALAEWRIWKTPMAFLSAYTGMLSYFYWYFIYVAGEAAARGERGRALRAVGSTFCVFPFRACYHLLTRAGLRRSLLVGLFGAPRAMAARQSS